MPLPRVKPGQPITAGLFNALVEAANAQSLTVAQGSGLAIDRGVLYATIPGPMWAKITGAISGGAYPFTQQFPAASGAWTNGPLTGNAVETTGNTSVATGTIVQVWRTPAGDWRFRASQC